MGDRKRTVSGKHSLHTNRGSTDTVVFVTKGMVLNDRYHLIREIGRGGMAVVFEAEDKTLDGERVAIKVLSPELAHSKAAIIRLKNEARAAMKLTHENIMRLNSFEEDGVHNFLVMELLDGENLEVALAERSKLPIDEVLEIARGAASGLAAAHEQNIIHRDIKPANLMYKSIGERQVIKIADFGIAFELKETLTRLTGMESAGTLLYAAPEQLEGALPDARSDQYALAATLYELLTGKPPFSGVGLSHQIINADPRPLKGVPANIDGAVRKALSKKPGERFADCTEFLKALETPLADEKTKSESYGLPLIGLCILIGLFAFFYGRPKEPLPKPTEKPTATTKATLVTTATVTATVKATEVASSVATAAPTKVVASPSVTTSTQPKVAAQVPPEKPTLSPTTPTTKQPAPKTLVATDKPVAVSPPALEPKWGKVKLVCQPSSATLVLKRPNDAKFKPINLSSGISSKELRAGTYSVTITATGYRSDDVIVSVPSDGTIITKSVSLVPLPVSIALRSEPSGCHVTIEDNMGGRTSVGTTPCAHELAPGRYKVLFDKDGYEASATAITVRPGIGRTVKGTLKVEPNIGFLHLSVNPQTAEVEVDGKSLAPSQWTNHQLSVGPHLLSGSHPGYETSSKQVAIVRGKVTNETLHLSRRPIKMATPKPATPPVLPPENPDSATSIRQRLIEQKIKLFGQERTAILESLAPIESSAQYQAQRTYPSVASVATDLGRLLPVEEKIRKLRASINRALKDYGSTSSGDDLRGFFDATVSDANKVQALRKKLEELQKKKPVSELKADITRLQNRVQSKLHKGSEYNRARSRLKLYSPKRTLEVFFNSVLKRQETNFMACLSGSLLEKAQKELSKKGTKKFYEEVDKSFAEFGSPKSFRITITKEKQISATEKEVRFKCTTMPKESRATLIKAGRYWLLKDVH